MFLASFNLFWYCFNVCTNVGCAHRRMVMVQGTTVDQVRNHLEPHTAVRGIIVVMVTGCCLFKLKKLFDEIAPRPLQLAPPLPMLREVHSPSKSIPTGTQEEFDFCLYMKT